MTKRKIVHLEFNARDRAALGRFYADLFGWEVRDFPDMDYTTLNTGNEELGIGIGQVTEQNPPLITWYIESTDLAADLKAIEARGGTVVEPLIDVPGVGQMAYFTDPAGNFMALGKFLPQGSG